jgi:hypothetical protein
VKNYRTGAARGPDHRYESARDPFITKKAIFGAPELDRATTSHIERHNGTMRHHIGRMRRLCCAFSKDLDHHKAAVALCHVHYNLCWIPRTTRVTPARAAGATGHAWELAELLDALLSTPDTAAPDAKPLSFPPPQGTAQALPNERGFLRVVDGGGAPPSPHVAPPSPAASPVAAVGNPSAPSPPAEERLEPTGQLDLFTWRPKPRPMGQLSLFGQELGSIS